MMFLLIFDIINHSIPIRSRFRECEIILTPSCKIREKPRLLHPQTAFTLHLPGYICDTHSGVQVNKDVNMVRNTAYS